MTQTQAATGHPAHISSPKRRVLLATLVIAALGVECEPQRRAIRNPETASAFAFDSSVRSADVGDGLLALTRTSADGVNKVLCVYNVSGQSQIFDPSAHLSFPSETETHSPIFFVHGQTTTHQSPAGTLLCRLQASSFVWLGRSQNPAAQTIDGTKS
jgi:hypothetical protein